MLVASPVITFFVAPWWFRLIYGLVYTLLTASFVIGVLSGNGFLIGAAIGLLFVLLLSPVLRSKRDLIDISIRAAIEGIEVENAKVKTLCKWGILKSPRRFGRFLYVPIGPRIAFAVPASATTAENLTALEAYVRGGIAAI